MSKTFGFRSLSEISNSYRISYNYQYLFLIQNRDQVNGEGKGYELLLWKNSNYLTDPMEIYQLDDTLSENPIVTIIDSDPWVEIRKDGKKMISQRGKFFFSGVEMQNYGLLYFNTNLSTLIERLNIV